MLKLGDDVCEHDIVDAAKKASIRLHGASNDKFHYQAKEPALILGYGGLLETDIDKGVQRLALVLDAMRK